MNRLLALIAAILCLAGCAGVPTCTTNTPAIAQVSGQTHTYVPVLVQNLLGVNGTIVFAYGPDGKLECQPSLITNVGLLETIAPTALQTLVPAYSALGLVNGK